MKKITREEYRDHLAKMSVVPDSQLFKEALWSRIQEAQSSEPMSVEEMLDRIKAAGWSMTAPAINREFLSFLSSLTVQQGFVPDWSKAPVWATSIVMVWSRQNEPWGVGRTEFNRIPRPVRKMRPKTYGELLGDLEHWRTHGRSFTCLNEDLSRETVEALCRAAGIPLEVQS